MKLLNLFLLGFIIFLNPWNTHAQSNKFNLGIGYNAGTHLKTGGLDFVIGRYNETRSYLSKTMNKPRFFRGINLAMELFYKNGLANFEWVVRKSDMSAETNDTTGNTQQRDLRLKMNTFNMGYAYKLTKNEESSMGSYVGMDFSTISVKTYTRVFQNGGSSGEYSRIDWKMSIGFSPFFQYVANRYTAKVYCQFMISKANYWDENVRINPNTWYDDSYENNKGKSISTGLCVRYNVFQNKKK